MAESTGVALSQMNQETALAQEALRDESPQGHPDPRVDRRHEERDANLKVIALTTATMGVMGIVMFVGLGLLLSLFARTPAPPVPPISTLALNPPTPVGPRIEDATPQNFQRFLRTEENTLRTFGPIPLEEHAPENAISNLGPGVEGPQGIQSSTGTFHIPLEQAKTSLLQRGFPTRSKPEPTQRPQTSHADGADKPQVPRLEMQPTETYRVDERIRGRNP